MQSSLTVITPAKSVSLVSLYEAKLALNITSSSELIDDQLEMLIEWSSAEIAAMCNRTFARETVTETFHYADSYHNRLFLSRWPVTEITAVDEDGTALISSDYTLDSSSGLIRRSDDVWGTPLSVTYTGGYDLPNESPMALRQAALLMTREGYFAMSRGDASIRMISHKESRVIYFDPNAKSASVGSSSGSPARRAIGELLKHFMRFEV